MSSISTRAGLILEQGEGIVHLAPNWIPRGFAVPGKRLRLHPYDYFSLGAERGPIVERWFASTVKADNGPQAPETEGLSKIVFDDGNESEGIFFQELVSELKGELVGDNVWQEYEDWPAFSKFFDYAGALPFHLHHRKEHALAIGKSEKPESYFFPTQLNFYQGSFPYTFFGLQPNITKEQFKKRLLEFSNGDNAITDLSIAYRLVLGTAWDVPAGVLHAPGSLCTYEPQWASDVGAIFQSLIGGRLVPDEMLWTNVPADKQNDYDYLIELIDWDANIDPHFKENHFMQPVFTHPQKQMAEQGYSEKWIIYKTPLFAAKELTVFPNKSVNIFDDSAYGLIAVQGYGTLGKWQVESPTLIRFGQMTSDEFFVSDSTARKGVEIQNLSSTEPLVMLKHFGPNHGAHVLH